jgi:hypothetical protein
MLAVIRRWSAAAIGTSLSKQMAPNAECARGWRAMVARKSAVIRVAWCKFLNNRLTRRVVP